MFGTRLIASGLVLLALVAAALGAARPSSGAGPEARRVVRSGDTLWSIAAATYGGDPREGIWRIQRRNGLDGAIVRPGQVLVIPR
jgi:nucleoid-associated protein YgaU